MKKIIVLITDEQEALLVSEARRLGISKSAYVRKYLPVPDQDQDQDHVPDHVTELQETKENITDVLTKLDVFDNNSETDKLIDRITKRVNKVTKEFIIQYQEKNGTDEGVDNIRLAKYQIDSILEDKLHELTKNDIDYYIDKWMNTCKYMNILLKCVQKSIN